MGAVGNEAGTSHTAPRRLATTTAAWPRGVSALGFARVWGIAKRLRPVRWCKVAVCRCAARSSLQSPFPTANRCSSASPSAAGSPLGSYICPAPSRAGTSARIGSRRAAATTAKCCTRSSAGAPGAPPLMLARGLGAALRARGPGGGGQLGVRTRDLARAGVGAGARAAAGGDERADALERPDAVGGAAARPPPAGAARGRLRRVQLPGSRAPRAARRAARPDRGEHPERRPRPGARGGGAARRRRRAPGAGAVGRPARARQEPRPAVEAFARGRVRRGRGRAGAVRHGPARRGAGRAGQSGSGCRCGCTATRRRRSCPPSTARPTCSRWSAPTSRSA